MVIFILSSCDFGKVNSSLVQLKVCTLVWSLTKWTWRQCLKWRWSYFYFCEHLVHPSSVTFSQGPSYLHNKSTNDDIYEGYKNNPSQIIFLFEEICLLTMLKIQKWLKWQVLLKYSWCVSMVEMTWIGDIHKWVEVSGGERTGSKEVMLNYIGLS